MTTKPKTRRKIVKADDPEQFKRFVETAKEIGANPDPKAFDRAFKKIVSTKKPR